MDEATVKTLLAPLFAQFATGDGDMAEKLMGYLVALEHAQPRALKAAVRSFLSGSVVGHDGKFIPTSAELARVVRAEQAHIDRVAPRLRIADAGRPEPTLEQRAAMQAKLAGIGGMLKWKGHGEENRKPAPSWMAKPLVEEVAAAPSASLLRTLQRQRKRDEADETYDF